MKIRVITGKYEYMGLEKGSVYDVVGVDVNGHGDSEYHFTNNGRRWVLTDEDCVEVNEKLLNLINTDSVLDIQHGGSHYKDKKIQPIEYITANDLDFCQGNIVKYATRHKNKNGAEDVRKIIHYAQFILKFEYGEEI